MVHGFALCADEDDYQRTFLDKMNLDRNYIQDNFNNKPQHIDKLFEHEDEFLENSIMKI